MKIEESRPEWIHCIVGERNKRGPTKTLCGERAWPMRWLFEDRGHAYRAVANGSRLVPCEKCMEVKP